MQRFIAAIEAAVEVRNWYAALAMGLVLPDLCARVEHPSSPSSHRYKEWWDVHVTPKYTYGKMTFLTADDAYALRCAYIHEGRGDIERKRADSALSRFRFMEPDESGVWVHGNRLDDLLQVQIDVFCRDICDGARIWLNSIKNREDLQENLSHLLRIYPISAPLFG